MKKLLLLLAVLSLSTMAMAQSLDKVFEKYKAYPNAESMTITKDMLNMMISMGGMQNLSDEDRATMEMLKNIDQMSTLTFENAEQSLGMAMISDVREALKKGYEITTDMQEGDDSVLIAVKKKKKADYASEVIIAAHSDNEAVLMYITGKIKVDDISNLMNIGK